MGLLPIYRPHWPSNRVVGIFAQKPLYVLQSPPRKRCMGAHRALCEKFPPMARVTAVTTVVPDTRLLRFLLKSKPSDKAVFHTESAGSPSRSV